MARYGLYERAFSITVCSLDSTKCNTVLGKSKGALGIIYQRSGIIAVGIYDHKTLLLNFASPLFGHIFCIGLILLLQNIDLVQFQWCARIALYATCSLAVREVAAEIFLEKVE